MGDHQEGAPVEPGAGMPVVPVSLGQVHLPGGLAGLQHGGHEQVPSEEVLVVEVAHQQVVLVVEHQRPLHRRTGLRGGEEGCVEIGHEPVAQPQRLADDRLDRLTPCPGVLVDVPDLGVVAAEGGQRAVLHPPQVELGVRVAGEAPDVGADERLTGDAQARAHRDADPQVVPAGLVVAHPVGGISLDPGESRAGQYERPPVGHGREQPLGRPHRHQQGVLVVVALVGVASLVEAHGRWVDVAGGGLVHVVPDAGQAGLDVGGVELPPPRACLLAWRSPGRRCHRARPGRCRCRRPRSCTGRRARRPGRTPSSRGRASRRGR